MLARRRCRAWLRSFPASQVGRAVRPLAVSFVLTCSVVFVK
jgi:hypothetical protein